MLTILALWNVQSGSEDAISRNLTKMREHTRKEPGNYRYDIYRNIEEASKILIHEEYGSEADFQFHQAQAYFKDLVLEKSVPFLAERELKKL